MDEREIRALFAGHSVPLSPKDVWAVQGTPVIKHAALERLSAALKLVWDLPTIVRAERDECVVLVRAARPDKDVSEWSFGEALIVSDGQTGGNYKVSGKQASYVFAMAEKRGKDRVIIKLAGLHGAYSEEEADDFKASNGDARSQSGSITILPPLNKPSPDPEIARLIMMGDEASDRGTDALRAFWGGLSKDRKRDVGGEAQLDKWKAKASEIDAADQKRSA